MDVLVDFEPSYAPGWNVTDLEDELGRLLCGRKVDMVNPKYLNRRLRDRILDNSQVQYEEG